MVYPPSAVSGKHAQFFKGLDILGSLCMTVLYLGVSVINLADL